MLKQMYKEMGAVCDKMNECFFSDKLKWSTSLCILYIKPAPTRDTLAHSILYYQNN